MIPIEWQDPDSNSAADSQRLYETVDGTNSASTMGDWDHYAWTLCAATSIVTSKYILVDFNYHYPLHLVMMQLVTAGAVTLLTRAAKSGGVVDPVAADENHPRLLFISNCLDASSLALASQAILHFPNISTLAMLPILAAAVGLMGVFHCLIQPRAQAFRILALATCFSTILHGEYRLTVNGLAFSIPAAICAGASKSLRLIHHNKHTLAASSIHNFSFYACSLALTVAWAVFEEKTWNVISDLRLDIAPTLALNIVSSAAVIILGRSWILPSYSRQGKRIMDCRNIYSVGEISSYLALAGLTGYGSVITLRRSYTSLLQFVAYLAAILCLDNGRLFGLVNMIRSQPQGSTSPIGSSREGTGQNGPRRSRETIRRVLNSPIRLVLGCLIVGLWVAFIAKNFTEHSTPGLPLSLDVSYTPRVDTEIVVSMYHEPLDSVGHLIASLKAIPSLSSAIVHVYTKDESADVDNIKLLTGANTVTQLSNIGREGETYLRHIVENWDSLAAHTLFVQGDVHNPREFFPRVRDYYDPENTGMLSLGFSGNVCQCSNCADRWGWSDSTVYEVFAEIYPMTPCSKLLLSYKGQFIASAKRIRGVRREIYKKLLDALTLEDSWAHREDYLKGRDDSMSAPFFGFTLERLWNVLMQCSDLDIAWKCPTLLSGTRSGGNKTDCQCFD